MKAFIWRCNQMELVIVESHGKFVHLSGVLYVIFFRLQKFSLSNIINVSKIRRFNVITQGYSYHS